MVGLGIRLLIAGASLFMAGVVGLYDFDIAWKISVAIAAIGFFGWRLDAKGLMNSGLAGFFAIADAYAISLILSEAGYLDYLGFLVLAPCAITVALYRSPATFLAPLAASSLLVSHAALNEGKLPGSLLLLQAAGVMGICLLLREAQTQTVVTSIAARESDDQIILDKEGYLELRENFRKLRDAYRDLEYKSRRGRMTAALEEARTGQSDRLYHRLADKVKEVCGADYVAIYTVAKFDNRFIVRGTTAGTPDQLSETAILVNIESAPGQIRHRADIALASLRTDVQQSKTANVVLVESGHVVGLLTVGHTEAGKLVEASARAEEIGPYLAGLLLEEERLDSERRRLKEAELLYDVATITAGSSSTATIAGRVARELKQSIQSDHVGVFFIEGQEALALANQGSNVRLIDAVSFSGKSGVAGWLAAGTPEFVAFDARECSDIDANESLKRRVGSFVLIPLRSGSETIGFITCITHLRGGIDQPQLSTIRIATLELGQALARIESRGHSTGFMTPSEFGQAVNHSTGSFVYIELLRKDSLLDTFGRFNLEGALRKLASRLVKTLPAGGGLCRRDEGDFVAFLPNKSLEDASKWATSATSLASLVDIETADGSVSAPLGIRAKVAEIHRQEHEVFSQVTA